ncbi:hypothetical protein PGT21_020568 [Puccinia graminis f. sp. tritici]|uniref:Uncharacterized protein n=1 Tax=Puccinia graminis f. sp. tritici TaxID=56615 RepID=A0A5B0NS80_PUCGR|nr:hypothetical protein PGT21_020568 [Puccinia graminis f. sp. tritici]
MGQNLVREHNGRRTEERLRRAAIEVANQEKIVVDEDIDCLDRVVDENRAPDSDCNQTCSGNNSGGNQFEDPPEIELEDVPLEIFEEDEFEDKEAELTWMGFIEIAVGQIRSEPEENTPDESIPLFDQVEEKIKKMTPDSSTCDMAINGFEAYDITISQKVHVMASVLCFQADSPMHAEITNTHVPGNALNSCRYCVLSSGTLKDRKKMPYIAQFTQKNLHGADCPNKLRTMEETIKNSKKLWTCAKETLDLDKLNKKSSELAVRDQINLKFSNQLFHFQEEKIALIESGEELPEHMDQDIPQKLVDMEENEPKRMFSPFLELKGFDTVKDTPVEILHVFLLGAFNVTQPQVSQLVGRINSIWTVQKPSYQTSYYIHTTVFQKMEKSKFYKMREIRRTPREAFVHSSNIETGLNAQHDCHRGGCQLAESEASTNTVERRPTSTKKVELIHCDDNQFIINLASLSAAACHRKASDVINESKTRLEWIDSMHNGLKTWQSVVEKNEAKASKKNANKKNSASTMDPDLE